MNNVPIQVAPAWEQLSIDRLRGTVLVIGDTDTGKSTFARYLCDHLGKKGVRVATLDGDPGQSALGPPTTMTLALAPASSPQKDDVSLFFNGQIWRWFVGDISPGRHLLNVLTGAARLVQAGYEAGAEIIVYDTTGFISPVSGGTALKLALIDLLRPTVVFAIQRHFELESLLPSLRRSRRVRVVDLKPCAAVARRISATRQAYRAAQYARYFDSAHPLQINTHRSVILPTARLFPQRLVALENGEGFTLGLGIVLEHDRSKNDIVLQTPLASLDDVDVLHPGDVIVDPETFQDRRLTNGVS
jgi:polynucleotide 5'-hydroxyl-kinase GRC3/NOL9